MKNSLIAFLRRSFIKLALIAVCIFSFVGIVINFANYKKQAREISQTIENEQKEQLKQYVANVKDYIRYNKDLTERRLKEALKVRVEEAISIMDHHYLMHKDDEHNDDLARHMVDLIRPMRFFNGRGYYFATKLDGLEILLADKPELENKNLWDMKSTDGKYVIQEMIKIAKTKGEGYVEYEWTKPGVSGNHHKKIAFIKYFPPLEAFVGSGDYFADVENDIKEEVLQRIISIKFANDGYVFAGTWEGVSLAGPAKGKNMLHFKDKDGVYIVKELIALARKGGGFLEYQMPPLNGVKSAPKISYVESIDEWGWYIGAGAYKEDIQALVDSRRKDLLNNSLIYLFIIIVFAVFMLFVVMSFERKLSVKVSSDIETFEQLLRNAIERNKLVDCSFLEYGEFMRIAAIANKILDEKSKLESMVLQTAKMDSLGKLSAGMAHEINNPLSAVLQAAQNLQRRLDFSDDNVVELAQQYDLSIEELKRFLKDRKIIKFAQMIEDSGVRAANIVNNMLTFSRKSHGVAEFVDARDLIDNVMSYLSSDYDLKADYDFKKIKINIEISRSVAKLYCIVNELEQVLLNIIKNAAYAVSLVSAEREAKINVRIIEKVDQHIIEIEDNGGGMSQDVIDHLFDPFFTTKPVGSGTGLGLFVSYFIIKNNHYGTIEVKSKPNQGTTFIIKIPINNR